eukprot:tig00001600_g9396.t1
MKATRTRCAEGIAQPGTRKSDHQNPRFINQGEKDEDYNPQADEEAEAEDEEELADEKKMEAGGDLE